MLLFVCLFQLFNCFLTSQSKAINISWMVFEMSAPLFVFLVNICAVLYVLALSCIKLNKGPRIGT